jgi:D-alanyl-lipoteichoic acid acyltransferase DltB (MBOAT superfamily)
MPQIQSLRSHVPNVHHAALLILSGLFKKVILATLLYESGVPNAFYDPESQTALGLWIASFGYTAQLYCDFSGYTDMALGIALLFGFILPPNFASPYTATNIGDFWKRWHISFSQWLRDYIYLPLGGSWKSPNRISLNLFLTFLFCGIWHGASWGYIIWGGIHGIGLAAHKRRRDILRKKGIDPTRSLSLGQALIGWSYTILFVSLSRVVFQTPDLEHAQIFYIRMFDPYTSGESISWMMILIICITFAINLWGSRIFAVLSSLSAPTNPKPSFNRMIGYTFLIISTLYVLFTLMPSGIPPYLYARF